MGLGTKVCTIQVPSPETSEPQQVTVASSRSAHVWLPREAKHP